MKKLFIKTAVAVSLLICFSGCIKNDPVLVVGQQVEFDATSWNSNAAGLTYPIIGRVPGYGRVANTSDSTLRRYPQTIKVRINLIGAQLSSTTETVGYEVSTLAPITTFAMPVTTTAPPQSPAAPATTLAIVNAVAGTHYAPLNGKITFAANTSFAFIDITILNPGPTPGEGRYLGLKLNGTGTLKPALNYNELGLVIDQR